MFGDEMVDEKKERKKALIKKNRRTQEIFNAFRIMRAEGDRVRKEEEGRLAGKSPATTGDDAVWSEKVATIRNRLTDQKRTSKERWNRFAGTSGGGGRGL